MSANIEGMLTEAQRELEAGRKDEAMTLLLRVAELDERNERAWLLLSQTVDTDEEKRTCLDNVIIINPDNQAARQMLDDLDRAMDEQMLGGDDPFGMAELEDSSADVPFSAQTTFDPPASTPDDDFEGPFGVEESLGSAEPPPPVSRVPATEATSNLGAVYDDDNLGGDYVYGYDADDLGGDYGYGDDDFGDPFEDEADDYDEDFLGMIPDNIRPTRSPGMDEKPNTGLIIGISVLGVFNLLAIGFLVLQMLG